MCSAHRLVTAPPPHLRFRQGARHCRPIASDSARRPVDPSDRSHAYYAAVEAFPFARRHLDEEFSFV